MSSGNPRLAAGTGLSWLQAGKQVHPKVIQGAWGGAGLLGPRLPVLGAEARARL